MSQLYPGHRYLTDRPDYPGAPSGVPRYKGNFVAGLGGLYDDARGLAQQFLGGKFGAKGQTQNALLDILKGQSSYDLSPETTANYFQQSVVTPALRTYDRDIKPRIAEAFNTAGQGVFSSRQSEAQGQYLSDLQTGFGQQLAGLQYQNQSLAAQLAEGAAQRQLGGIGAAVQFQNQPLIQAGLLQQLGQPEQQTEQARLNAKFQEYLRTQPQNNPYLQLGLGVSGIQGVAPFQTQNPFANVLQGLGNFGAGSLFASQGFFGQQGQQNPYLTGLGFMGLGF